MKSKDYLRKELLTATDDLTLKQLQDIVSITKKKYVKTNFELRTQQLQGYLDKLPRSARSFAIELIASHCGVKRTTVYNWKYGVNRITNESANAIETAIGKSIFI